MGAFPESSGIVLLTGFAASSISTVITVPRAEPAFELSSALMPPASKSSKDHVHKGESRSGAPTPQPRCRRQAFSENDVFDPGHRRRYACKWLVRGTDALKTLAERGQIEDALSDTEE
ncbi:unnamed protein product [Mycena citricolor]|uniref:Uncharacterized protein n=1 Tax=Mycena citricolor TaxID=2018698 RepID=A0AAD2HLM3_9AGAR|nr:unnamed protein product [Mycena citricolor]